MMLGPIGLMGSLFFARFLGFAGNIPIVLGAGVVLGAIVGLWTGFTCGDEMTGAGAGAILGGVAMGFYGLLQPGELGALGVLLTAIFGMFVGGIAGFFVGMMVERSIGQ
jgi:hypothetical protein